MHLALGEGGQAPRRLGWVRICARSGWARNKYTAWVPGVQLGDKDARGKPVRRPDKRELLSPIPTALPSRAPLSPLPPHPSPRTRQSLYDGGALGEHLYLEGGDGAAEVLRGLLAEQLSDNLVREKGKRRDG